MARYQCRACGFDGHATWNGSLICPQCGSETQVRAAVLIEEWTEADLASFVAAIPDSEDDPR